MSNFKAIDLPNIYNYGTLIYTWNMKSFHFKGMSTSQYGWSALILLLLSGILPTSILAPAFSLGGIVSLIIWVYRKIKKIA
jgi:hypothetical protein